MDHFQVKTWEWSFCVCGLGVAAGIDRGAVRLAAADGHVAAGIDRGAVCNAADVHGAAGIDCGTGRNAAEHDIH